jgi:hypothetical protein
MRPLPARAGRKLPAPTTPLTIRRATPGDTLALLRLASLDSAPALWGRVLVAERDELPIAAISLESGAAVADPFRHTADAVQLLRRRRYEILRRGRVGQIWVPLPRLAGDAAG